MVLELIGGRNRFEEWMRQGRDEKCLETHERKGIRDDEARMLICRMCKVSSGTQLQRFEKKERDEALHRLKDRSLTVGQLERLTGINRGVIQKA